MPLTESTTTLPTADGDMQVFCAAPAGPGPWPVVFFYMDALGIREELRDMVRRIANQGYLCVLPDLFYRSGLVRLNLARGLPAVLPVARALLAQLTSERVTADTAALLQWIDTHPSAGKGAAGCVGHCMSGRYVVTCMARYPERLVAGASLYGTGLVTDEPESPHRLLPQVRGELYFAFGGRDEVIPAATRDTLKQALDAAGTAHQVEVFEDAGHGFAFPERPAYNAAAAEASWQQVFALLGRHLARSPQESNA